MVVLLFGMWTAMVPPERDWSKVNAHFKLPLQFNHEAECSPVVMVVAVLVFAVLVLAVVV